MRWTAKARIQRMLSAVPGGFRLYYLAQRSFGHLRDYTIDGKVQQGFRLIKALSTAGVRLTGARTIEVGTGWAPVVPMLFWAYGADACDTFDVSPLLKWPLVRETARQFVRRGEAVVDAAPDEEARRSARVRLRELEHRSSRLSPDALLHACGITYHPSTRAAPAVRTASVDVFFSNVVLEHVPIEDVRLIFDEARRVLAPSGVMVHLIDPSDHFSHSDSTISPINFLQFSERAFRRYNTPFLYQNRLRVPAWRQAVESAGFAVTVWEPRVDHEALERLRSIEIAEMFRRYSDEELCTTSVCVVAAPRVSEAARVAEQVRRG